MYREMKINKNPEPFKVQGEIFEDTDQILSDTGHM